MGTTKKIKQNLAPLTRLYKREKRCLEMTDTSTLYVDVSTLFPNIESRDTGAILNKLAMQLLEDNQGILTNYGVTASKRYDRERIFIDLHSGSCIGALPLLSPITGKPDFGLVIKPRFEWSGLGPMLATMGWRVIPQPLRLPLLPGTERKIPIWVLSSIIIFRLEMLLRTLRRSFRIVERDLRSPKGKVNWDRYAIKKFPQVKMLEVPCIYPVLKDDTELKAAIHYTLRKHEIALQGQRAYGNFVLALLNKCSTLISEVRDVKPQQPSKLHLSYWNRYPFTNNIFKEGLQSIEWTVDERGLAGVGDLQGLPWMMSMDKFFEAWIESIAEKTVRLIGGEVRKGRKNETIIPISWDQPYLGSQKYLLPDVIIKREDEIIILDAKYKRHWEELSHEGWSNITDLYREQHRADLLQVLAYSTAYEAKKISSCLIYPCSRKTWRSLKERGQLIHKASIYAGTRKVNLILTAIPMDSSDNEVLRPLYESIQFN